MVQYEHESELIWNKDPSDLEYLREKKIQTRKKKGIPQRYHNMYIVYGWIDLDDNTPTDAFNLYNKRFVIKLKDIGGPKHTNEFRMGSPSEAVEIDSIEVGEESKEHTLTMDDTERIFDI